MTRTTIDRTIEETAEVLEHFSADLAEAWRARPFRRMDLAFAFAAGFDKIEDVHPTASLVIHVAELDREIRRPAAVVDQAYGTWPSPRRGPLPPRPYGPIRKRPETPNQEDRP